MSKKENNPSEVVKIQELKKILGDGLEVFQDCIDGLSLGVGLYDSNAAPILCNEAAYTLLGMSNDQFLGKSAMDPFWKVTREDGSEFPLSDFPIVHTITTYKPSYNVIMGVFRPTKNDKVWLDVDTEPFLDRVGNIVYVICTFSDISDKMAHR